MMRTFIFVTCLTLANFVTGTSTAASSSNDGQYANLKGSYPCERDKKEYGSFYVWGYWKGGKWCGQTMPPGYYVYKDGFWFVWNTARR